VVEHYGMSDDEKAAHERSQPGSISAETIKTIATVVTVGAVFVGAAMGLGRLDANVTEFRAQYGRDSVEMRADMRAMTQQLVELKQRVAIIETQRVSEERETRSNTDAINARLTTLETYVRTLANERRR